LNVDVALEVIRDPNRRRQWDVVDDLGEEICRSIDPRAAGTIASIDLVPYTAALSTMVAEADRVRASRSPAAAYWEFDVDNLWRSAMYLCLAYRPQSAADDEWAANFDPRRVVTGPALPSFSANRRRSWDLSDLDAANTVFLLARTVAAFGRASTAWRSSVPLAPVITISRSSFASTPPDRSEASRSQPRAIDARPREAITAGYRAPGVAQRE
jgi:hypothetical protein